MRVALVAGFLAADDGAGAFAVAMGFAGFVAAGLEAAAGFALVAGFEAIGAIRLCLLNVRTESRLSVCL